jgi:predicted secreted protein
MDWPLGTALYFIIWWTMLFSVLPLWVRGQHETDEVTPGTEPGAPVVPHLGRKLLINTAVSGVVWLIADYFYINWYLKL